MSIGAERWNLRDGSQIVIESPATVIKKKRESETEILFPYGATLFASTMGQLAGNHFLPIVEGRGFASADDKRAPRVAVINQAFARRCWPTGGAVGRTTPFDAGAPRLPGLPVAAGFEF